MAFAPAQMVSVTVRFYDLKTYVDYIVSNVLKFLDI